MQKFRNGDGSYTVSHPIAMSLFLVLETEQRNKNYIIAQNEYQMTHMRNIVESANFAVRIRDEVSANIIKHIMDKLSSPVADSQKQIEKYTETLLQKLSDHEAQLDNQKNHRLDRGFLSHTREEHAAEVLGHRITVLKEDNEELRSERDDLVKANIGAQKLVAKLKGEKASWQEKYLDLLEGNKRPREKEEPDTSDAKRRSDTKSSCTSLDITSNNLEEKSSNTLSHQSSSSSARTSTHTSRNTLGNDTSSNSRASSQRHTSSSTSAHTDRGKASNAIIDHEHLSRVVEMNEHGKRAVRADLGLSFDPWEPQLTRWQQRLVILALWKREVRRFQRYVPDCSDNKAAGRRISHVPEFVHISQNWTYEEGISDLHEEYHNYHLRNYIPRVLGEYRKILNSPKLAAYTRCIPVDCYYEEILRDTPGFKQQALPRHRARST
jgi:hypothetical protein